MPIFAFSLVAIVTLAGAALALGMDSRAANNLQSAADSSALAGATAFLASSSPRASDRLEDARAMARSTAAANAEYVLTGLGVSAVTEDPYGQHTEIEVKLAFEPANPAAKMLGRNANVTIERTAAASATWGFPLCILSLSERGSGLATADDTSLVADNCVIWSNSRSSRSMAFLGGEAQSKHFCASGRASTRGSRVSPRPHENCDPIPDPLEDWTAPAAGSLIDTPISFEDRDLDRLRAQFDSIVSRSMSPEQLETSLREFYELVDIYREYGTDDPRVLLRHGINLLDISLDAVLHFGDVQTGWFHRDFQTKQGSVGEINEYGELIRYDAAGLRLDEVALLLGRIEKLDPDVYKDDKLHDSPTLTLVPGTYRGLDISTGHVRLSPGIYHMVDAPLVVRRRATLSGDGVTIIFHGDNARLLVFDEARLSLQAPTSGSTAGFVLAEDRNAPLSSRDPLVSSLSGSGTFEAIGTVYLPRQELSISGSGAAKQTSPLLQIVANNVRMSEQGALNIVFDPTKTDVPVTIKPERSARLIR